MANTDSQLIQIELDDAEKLVLRRGLLEWGGPASCTEEMAVALGFKDVHDLLARSGQLAGAIADGDPLTAADWFRVVLATEVVFASDLIGAGRDWSIVVGMSDEQTISVLRRLQQRLPKDVRRALGRTVGTRPPDLPQTR